MTASRAPDPSPLRDGEPGGRRLARFATEHAVRLQRRVWSGRVVSWDQHGSSGLTKVTAALLQAAQVMPDALVVDLGCGTGQISLPLARRGAQVLAVDVSSAMVRRLQAQAHRQGVQNLEALALPIEELVLPAWQRGFDRLQLRPAPSAGPGQGPPGGGRLRLAAPGRAADGGRHDVRPRHLG